MKHCPVCDTEHPDEHMTCPRDGAVLLGSWELSPDTVVRGRYRIVRKLGQGGMGIVYLAEHLLLGGRAALKFMAAELSRDPRFVRRFRTEARAMYQLHHANIVQVTDMDQNEDGSLFIVMEYMAGESLRSAIDTHPGGLPTERALSIVRGIAAGLGAAHGCQPRIIHRDIKPENILISRDGTPKILDFGIAAMAEDLPTMSRTRGPMLTPAYAAPEQWLEMPAAELDGRTDLYALGGVLFEMLTGQTAFHGSHAEGWKSKHLNEQLAVPSHVVPRLAEWPGLDAMVLRLLAREREQRTASVQEFLPELARVLEARAARDRAGEHRALAETATVRESARVEQPVERPTEKKPEIPDRPAVRTDPPPPGRSGMKPLMIAIAVVGVAVILILVGVLARGRRSPAPESAAQQPSVQSTSPAPVSPLPVEAPVTQTPPRESPQTPVSARPGGARRRPSLDISILPIGPDLAKQMHVAATYGLLVESTTPGGAADRAGLRGGNEDAYLGTMQISTGGDLIVSIDGREVTSAQQVSDIMNQHQPGDTIEVTFFRGSRKMTVPVTLGESQEPAPSQPAVQSASRAPVSPAPVAQAPPSESPHAPISARPGGAPRRPSLDISILPIGPDLAKQMSLAVSYGLLIESTTPGGAADRGGLRGGKEIAYLGNQQITLGGDLIVAIDGQEVTNAQQLSDVINQHQPGDTVEVAFFRGSKKITSPVTLGQSNEPVPSSPSG
jgi:eukaryotic-like serine/threonine-protein kinase